MTHCSFVSFLRSIVCVCFSILVLFVPTNVHAASSGKNAFSPAGDVPDIAVTPDSLSAELFTGQTMTQTLTISNNGTATLEWSISIVDPEVSKVVAKSPQFHSTKSVGKVKDTGVFRGVPDAAAIYRFDAPPSFDIYIHNGETEKY